MLFVLKQARWGIIPVQNLLLDLKHGYFCGGSTPTRFKETGALQIQHTNFVSLDEIFLRNDLGVTPDDVLVDVGCGKGRVIAYWRQQKLGRKYIGIELDPEPAMISKERFKDAPEVQIINGDAIENLPAEGTMFYLYNPFVESVVRRFCEKLEAIADRRKPVRVVYNNCRHAELFTENPAWDTRPISNKNAYPAILATLKRTSENGSPQR